MSNRLSYPPFQLDCITEAVGIVAAGEVLVKRELFANLVWNIQGPLQSLVIGNPDGHTVGASDDTADGEFARLEGALEATKRQLTAVASGESVPAIVGADSKAIDPATILLIIQLIQQGLSWIQEWRKRRNQPTPAPVAKEASEEATA